MWGDYKSLQLHRCSKCGNLKQRWEFNVVHARSITPHENRGEETRSSETKLTNNSANNEINKIFHICPNLDCEQRRTDLRERERWKLENNSHREFTEDIVDEIVDEIVTQERNDSRIILEAVDAVPIPSRQTDSEPTETEQSTADSPSDDMSIDVLSGTYPQLLQCDVCDSVRRPQRLPTGRFIYVCQDPSCDGHRYDQQMKHNHRWDSHHGRSTDVTHPDILREVCEACGTLKMQSASYTATCKQDDVHEPSCDDSTTTNIRDIEVHIKHGLKLCDNSTCKGRQRDMALEQYLKLRYGHLKDTMDTGVSELLYEHDSTSDENVFDTIYGMLEQDIRAMNMFRDGT